MTKYKFENGRLYKYVPSQNAYILCLSPPAGTTRAKAITMVLVNGPDVKYDEADLIDEMHF